MDLIQSKFYISHRWEMYMQHCIWDKEEYFSLTHLEHCKHTASSCKDSKWETPTVFSIHTYYMEWADETLSPRGYPGQPARLETAGRFIFMWKLHAISCLCEWQQPVGQQALLKYVDMHLFPHSLLRTLNTHEGNTALWIPSRLEEEVMHATHIQTRPQSTW